MRSMKYVAVLLFMLVLALSQPALVSAHAELVSSTPANGAVLIAAPAQVVAVFTEELKTSGPTITVTNAAGQQVDAGDGKVDLNDLNHKTLTTTLKPGLGTGSYTIHWKAITADDNGVTEGAISFTVTGTAAVPVTASTAPATSLAGTTQAAATLPSTGGAAGDIRGLVVVAVCLGILGLALRRRSAARS